MKLEELLEREDVPFELCTHPATYTAQGLAHEEHVSGYNVAKPVVVKGTRGFAMCVVPACCQVDLSRVGEVLDEPTVRLASEAELAQVFPDCELGAEPPLGRLFGMPTLIDPELMNHEELLFQDGTHTHAVRVHRADFERLADGRLATITRR